MLDKKLETFVIYVATLELPLARMIIHSFRVALIIVGDPIQVTTLKHDKAPIKVPIKYSDFLDIFSENKALVLLE